jgi:hypothetical protein
VQNMTARSGHLRQNKGMGQLRQDSRDRTSETGPLGQDSRDRTSETGPLGQDSRDRSA